MEQQARPGEEKIESGYANLDVGSIGGRHTGNAIWTKFKATIKT